MVLAMVVVEMVGPTKQQAVLEEKHYFYWGELPWLQSLVVAAEERPLRRHPQVDVVVELDSANLLEVEQPDTAAP
jgi:hypothetical protein